MAIISYHGEKEIYEDKLPQELLTISLKHKIPHMRECGGKGRCTTCRVHVIDGLENVLPRNKREQEIAQKKGWDNCTRLACQMEIKGNVTIQRLVRTTQDLQFLDSLTGKKLDGSERQIAVMFSDIRNFTSFSEKNLPYDILHILNRYFEYVGEPILNNGGYIDKYIGDGILAIFGLCRTKPKDICYNAIRAALGMLDSTKELNKSLKKDFGIEFNIGIGIHFGVSIVGSMGHPKRMQFTALGDTVNTASRVESSNKTAGTELLISETVYQYLQEEISVGKIITTELKGKSNQFSLYEVLGFRKPDNTYLIQSSFNKMFSCRHQVGMAFYDKLFSINPELKKLFSRNISEQARMLMQVLHFCIQGLTQFDKLKIEIEDLAYRHVNYGVQIEHFGMVKKALLLALEDFFKEEFTPELKTAWDEMIQRIAEIMINAAYV